MLALYIILGVIFYTVSAGFVYSKGLRELESNCYNCQSETNDCYEDHVFNAGIAAAFFPLAIPLLIGMALGDRETKDERRRRKELEEAEHKIELAKKQRQQEKELGLKISNLD